MEPPECHAPSPPSPPTQAPARHQHAEHQRPFATKSLNIMDPLLPTNNLGRSVSRANFLRIRRAFAHGAKTLASIMAKVG